MLVNYSQIGVHMDTQKLVEELKEWMAIMGKSHLMHPERSQKELRKGEFAILCALENIQDGAAVKMVDVAQHLQISKPAVSQYMRRLEATAMIERVHLDGDRRSVYIQLTKQGKQARKAFDMQLNKDLEEIVGVLGEEDVMHLMRIIEKISSHLLSKKEDIKHD